LHWVTIVILGLALIAIISTFIAIRAEATSSLAMVAIIKSIPFGIARSRACVCLHWFMYFMLKRCFHGDIHFIEVHQSRTLGLNVEPARNSFPWGSTSSPPEFDTLELITCNFLKFQR
jgi:hypothetical protein